jgi:hypothetical protein
VLRWRAPALVFAALALTGSSQTLQAQTQAPDLGYAKTVSWHLDGIPELGPMEPTIRSVLDRVHVTYAGVDKQTIDGFFPGPTYSYDPVKLPGWTPFYLYIRDTATILPMGRFYYGLPAQRSVVEEFLRLQYPDGSISATVGPDFKVDKATVTSDEETSAILAATEAFEYSPDPAWLKLPLRNQFLIDRLNHAMEWVLAQRRDPATGLIKRAHTTDWGDIKWESNSDPSHMQPGDQWTVSIYDQAIAYAALRGLAQLNAAVAKDPERARWDGVANELRASTDLTLWMDDPERGYFRIHQHVAPDNVHHDFNEDDVVAIGNAAAVYYGLADADKVPRILAALERARVEARAPKPGLTLNPAYHGWFQVQMGERIYQNGALWDWWAGRQASGEFWSGYWRLARDHLFMVARDWATHPGIVREWESPWLSRTGADNAYAGAAAVVGQAIVEGLYGVQIVGREITLAPRLDDLGGGVRLYSPVNDLYVAYEYKATERSESLAYGSNSPTAIAVRLPVRWSGPSLARLDGKDYLPVEYQRVGETVVASVVVPSGTHTVDVRAAPPARKKF